MADRVDVSDKTAISMPMRNLLSILAAVGIGVYAFFGIQEKLSNLQTVQTLMESDLVKNTEFRIKWPRGELGSLPADSEQFMLIEYMAGQMEKMQVQLDAMMHNAVNITRLQEDMKEARENIEKLKDKLREANGNN
jgi:succinate dehydrogenase/fumarate reductase flavoprotein subunit|tara:strand:- start:603 stop:1010 length:408 start_codon:yes stop_codon:yes gene_type:complete